MVDNSEDLLWPPIDEVVEKPNETVEEKKRFGFSKPENASVLYRQLGIQVEDDGEETRP